MTDNSPVVRWRRTGRKGAQGRHTRVKWHRISGDGRTACGLTIAWDSAEIGALGDGALCANCMRNLGSETEHENERTAA